MAWTCRSHGRVSKYVYACKPSLRENLGSLMAWSPCAFGLRKQIPDITCGVVIQAQCEKKKVSRHADPHPDNSKRAFITLSRSPQEAESLPSLRHWMFPSWISGLLPSTSAPGEPGFLHRMEYIIHNPSSVASVHVTYPVSELSGPTEKLRRSDRWSNKPESAFKMSCPSDVRGLDVRSGPQWVPHKVTETTKRADNCERSASGDRACHATPDILGDFQFLHSQEASEATQIGLPGGLRAFSPRQPR